MKCQLGADPGHRRVLHLEGCRLAKVPYRMLDGHITDEQVVEVRGASFEWTDGCEHCAPKLRRKIVSAHRNLALTQRRSPGAHVVVRRVRNSQRAYDHGSQLLQTVRPSCGSALARSGDRP